MAHRLNKLVYKHHKNLIGNVVSNFANLIHENSPAIQALERCAGKGQHNYQFTCSFDLDDEGKEEASKNFSEVVKSKKFLHSLTQKLLDKKYGENRNCDEARLKYDIVIMWEENKIRVTITWWDPERNTDVELWNKEM